MASSFTLNGTLQLRGGTLAEWTAKNPILADREIVAETDTKQFKIGDGITRYLTLPYGGLKGEPGSGSGADLSVLLAANGTTLVAGQQAGSGAVIRTQAERNGESLSILDFITSQSERAAILAGTSTADHTAEIQNAINAAGSTKELQWVGKVYTRQLTSSASVKWRAKGDATLAWYPTGTALPEGNYHVVLTGANVRIENLAFYGNQPGITSTQGCSGLSISGASPYLSGVSVTEYNGIGFQSFSKSPGLKRGLAINCRFDRNSGLGLQTIACSYLDFTNCSFDNNGHGFQVYWDNALTEGRFGFGTAIRLRSHDMVFTACTANRCGRDGFNVNQGSYNITFTDCECAEDKDGGFTLAADQTNSGLPGELEGPHHITFNNCRAWSNWTSGLAAYQTVHDITVNGGAFYNNHQLAGTQSVESSYFNGIYIAANSYNISINTNAYDNRPEAVIASPSVTGDTLTISATGLAPRAMYPKVSFYNAAKIFQGYGYIVDDVGPKIKATAFDGMNLAVVQAGWTVSQRVQHTGVFCDNNVRGEIHNEGSNFARGKLPFQGFSVANGWFGAGQNIILPKQRKSGYEMLSNPSFDLTLEGWHFNVAGATLNQAGNLRRSAGALRLTAPGGSQLYGEAVFIKDSILDVALNYVEYSAMVYSEAGNVGIQLYVTGSLYPTTVFHPGGGWKLLKIGVFCPDAVLLARVFAQPNAVGYFDNLSVQTVETK